MMTPPASSTPHTGQRDAGAASPAPSGRETGAAPRHSLPAGSLSTRGEGRGEAAPWQRLDAAWPVIAKSPTRLDGDAQRLVRPVLTQAAGKRLQRHRELEAARLWIWEPMPHLAEYVRQRRYFVPSLPRFQPPDLSSLLRKEASLALEVLVTPPGVLGVEVWQELLELQCQRIGQIYAALQGWLGKLRAQEALQHILEGLA